MNFNESFKKLIGHEGGLSMDPKDRGNWTGGAPGKGELKGSKYGVSAKQYPGEDIANLTLARAEEIYRRDYWGPANCDAAPKDLRFHLFDMAVNSGVDAAIRSLQRAVGETVDGIVGPKTLQAMQSMPPLRVAARFNGYRLAYMANAPTWPSHGRGWAIRIANNLIGA